MTEEGSGAAQLAAVRGLVDAATQRLLGDTIAVSDEQWRQASRLPGWSRGHVATHIARHAEATVRLCEGARTDTPAQMYASAEEREAGIQGGADRDGLALQIDLDTTAGDLDGAFDALDEQAWGRSVELRGGLQIPARLLPLTRLTEVVLHHVDLDVGYEIDQLDDETAAWLLDWLALRLGKLDFPALHLVADGSSGVHLGAAAEAREVRGPAAALVGWLTGRRGPEGLDGADGIDLPSF